MRLNIKKYRQMANRKRIQDDPENPAGSLSDSEVAVMGILWDAAADDASGIAVDHRGLTLSEVHERLAQRQLAAGSPSVPYPSVSTTLRRLAERGVIRPVSEPKVRPVAFGPVVSRDDAASQIILRTLKTVAHKSILDLIPQLLGNDPGAGHKTKALRSLIDDLRQSADEGDGADVP